MSLRHLNTYTLHAGAMVALAIIVLSTDAIAGGAAVGDAWFRSLPAGLPAGGYFTLHNVGHSTLTLTGATSSACGMIMLHKSSDKEGMSSMEEVSQVNVAPGATLKFAPGGYHLMCMDPKPSLKPGKSVDVSLLFADGTKLEVAFTVRNAAGK
ncbi:MAG: copper chaperone PCu(A)C [Alphaproteobacteria bacterium]|nr:copper chaperone PCu(A)C [Alphaproteobacteria bacterium]